MDCFINARLIGNSLAQYQSDHNGRLPSRLSELVPNYVEYTNIQLLFWPPTNQTGTNVSHQVDDEGTFVYLGKRSFRENVVMYERTNLWSGGQDPARVVILTTNLSVRLLPIKEVRTLLSNLPVESE